MMKDGSFTVGRAMSSLRLKTFQKSNSTVDMSFLPPTIPATTRIPTNSSQGLGDIFMRISSSRR